MPTGCGMLPTCAFLQALVKVIFLLPSFPPLPHHTLSEMATTIALLLSLAWVRQYEMRCGSSCHSSVQYLLYHAFISYSHQIELPLTLLCRGFMLPWIVIFVNKFYVPFVVDVSLSSCVEIQVEISNDCDQKYCIRTNF